MFVSTLLTLALAPVLLGLSLVLFPLAIVTTTIAVVALAARALLVYLELIRSLLIHHLRREHRAQEPQIQRAQHPETLSRYSSHRSGRHNLNYQTSQAGPASGIRRSVSARSISTVSVDSQAAPRLQPHGVYAAAATVTRDFEGIGGWRFPSADDESDKQWLTLNSRLELPVLARDQQPQDNLLQPQISGHIDRSHSRRSPSSRHRRSLTSSFSISDRTNRGSFSTTADGIAGAIATSRAIIGGAESENGPVPKFSRPASFAPVGVTGSDSSPEERLSRDARTKSMIALGDATTMNIGRMRRWRRRESSGSSVASDRAQGKSGIVL